MWGLCHVGDGTEGTMKYRIAYWLSKLVSAIAAYRFRRYVQEGARAPWGYGSAYFDFATRYIVVYPIPCNWLVRWLRECYFLLLHARGGVMTKRLEQAYWEGNDQAHRGQRAFQERWQRNPRYLAEWANRLDDAEFIMFYTRIGKRAIAVAERLKPFVPEDV